MRTPLPRSLAPLTDESLPGYLLRLAHRLDLSPLQLSRVAGLTSKGGRILASRMLALRPETLARFAHTVRLTVSEATELTLASMAPRYPPVDLTFSLGARRRATTRHRAVHGVFVKENWILSRSSRYCPPCLAGDRSTVQERHGGAWSRLWRLPIVFACPTHRRLLEHACHACDQPALLRGTGAGMIPLHGDSTLHPTACRHRTCGNRLDQLAASTPPGLDLTGPLALQERLLHWLRNDEPGASVGQPATPAQYFIDLRILVSMITASWPTARHMVDDHRHADLIDQHTNLARRQIEHIQHRGGRSRDNAVYDTPPLASAPCAALLTAADAITRAGDADTVRELLLPLLEHAAAGRRIWIRQFLRGEGSCSPGLQTALGPEVGAKHVIARTGVKPAAVRRRLRHTSPPPRPMRFGPQHIPHRPLPEWIDAYFADFTAIKPRLLHHVIAARLAQVTLGGAAPLAAIPLGMSRRATAYAVDCLNRTLAETSRQETFEEAIGALAEHLDTRPTLINYGKRRQALATWSIPPSDWDTLVEDLRATFQGSIWWRRSRWDEPKKTLMSVWVWHHVTRGDHIYNPHLRPDPQGPRRRSETAKYVQGRWPLINSQADAYRRLRDHLRPYSADLAAKIDADQPRRDRAPGIDP